MGNIIVNLEFENGSDSIHDTERMSLDSHSMKHSHVLKMEKPGFCNCRTTHMHIASQGNFSMTILVIEPSQLKASPDHWGFCFCLGRISLCSSIWLGTHCLDHAGLELTEIHQPQQCWDGLKVTFRVSGKELIFAVEPFQGRLNVPNCGYILNYLWWCFSGHACTSMPLHIP